MKRFLQKPGGIPGVNLNFDRGGGGGGGGAPGGKILASERAFNDSLGINCTKSCGPRIEAPGFRIACGRAYVESSRASRRLCFHRPIIRAESVAYRRVPLH